MALLLQRSGRHFTDVVLILSATLLLLIKPRSKVAWLINGTIFQLRTEYKHTILATSSKALFRRVLLFLKESRGPDFLVSEVFIYKDTL